MDLFGVLLSLWYMYFYEAWSAAYSRTQPA